MQDNNCLEVVDVVCLGGFVYRRLLIMTTKNKTKNSTTKINIKNKKIKKRKNMLEEFSGTMVRYRIK